jgi:hypothetical protein
MLKKEDRLMAKFNLDNYETVEDRLKKFWKENPDARINTEIAHITEDGTCVTIRAEVFKQEEDARPVATGIAQETKGQGGFANADAWMENCETSAIGRALANWKYQGSDKARPSREEMSKVQVEKKPVKKPTKQEQEAMNKVVDDMVDEPTNTTGDVGKQLNQLLEAMIPDEALRQTIKQNAYKELVNNGIADKDIKSWTKENMDVFMTRAEDMLKMLDNNTTDDSDLVEEVFGEVTASVVRTCPECNSPDWIEDNREKKASDERFAKIPSWSCSTYQGNNGCGWTAWGDTDCPKEWL